MMKKMSKNEANSQEPKERSTSNVIDIEGNGIFLSYQMLILLVGGLISLGITISVYNSYSVDIESNGNNIKELNLKIEDRYNTLDNRIEQKNDDVLKRIDSKFKDIEQDVDMNSERYKEWIKSNSSDIDKLKEEVMKLKYTKK